MNANVSSNFNRLMDDGYYPNKSPVAVYFLTVVEVTPSTVPCRLTIVQMPWYVLQVKKCGRWKIDVSKIDVVSQLYLVLLARKTRRCFSFCPFVFMYVFI